MKLRLDEYYYIISDEIEDYMPQYMVEELDKFRESHTPEEAFDYLENLYSHIEIIDTQYRTNYIDLEKSYINYTAIIKIEDKEDSQRGGFYVTNGILNYKKPVKGGDYQIINKYNENQKRFNKLYLRPLIKALIESRVPQCIGKYLLREGEKTIYIDFYPGVGYYENIWNKRQI